MDAIEDVPDQMQDYPKVPINPGRSSSQSGWASEREEGCDHSLTTHCVRTRMVRPYHLTAQTI
jgi:hypothetical protein